MKRINLSITAEELKLLIGLASDQLFRRQFIDPRMPGYKSNREEVEAGKALVVRMRQLIVDGAIGGGAVLAPTPTAKQRGVG
jgi:hypothetical protein